jgi:hypothetical protein
MNNAVRHVPKPKPSPLRERLDQALAAIKILESLGIQTTGITLGPERVTITLENDCHHPRLKGLFRGEISDSSGRWCIYESNIDKVVLRWLVSRNRRVCDGL